MTDSVRVLTREDVVSLLRVPEDTINHEDGAVTHTWHLALPSWTDSTPQEDHPLLFLIREHYNNPDVFEDVVEIYPADDDFMLTSLSPFVQIDREDESSVEAAVAQLISIYNTNKATPEFADVDALLKELGLS